MTVALHYIYNTPEDRIVWDVGHQSYPHKILTGRRDGMHSPKNATACPSRNAASEYDTFGVGHAGTSLVPPKAWPRASNARALNASSAVIGDGAMTAAAFEALNHAGECGTDMLVILNDNEMSISPNVGAIGLSHADVVRPPLLIGSRRRKRV